MEHFKAMIEARIDAWCASLPASGLYPPMAYLMKLPAKRVRPITTLMACEVFGGQAEMALDEALGIELFHNFTLMHDDIMDASPLRRGDPTVHVKWNANTAILSGDALLVKAYEQLGRDAQVLSLFNACALQVCEGQQMDMEFEHRADVLATEYMEMIRLKTAVLLACALQVGATIGGASEDDRMQLGCFGEQLGLAFQLRDDLLDAFGDPAQTGKQRGGDLRNGKKTALLIQGLELERAQGPSVLADQLALAPASRDVDAMVTALERLGVRETLESEIATHEQRALAALQLVNVRPEQKAYLAALAERLMGRKA